MVTVGECWLLDVTLQMRIGRNDKSNLDIEGFIYLPLEKTPNARINRRGESHPTLLEFRMMKGIQSALRLNELFDPPATCLLSPPHTNS